jgi:hypothetical protein
MPMYYHPHHSYDHNPLTRGQKIAIGVGAATVVGLGVFLFWPRKASAATIPDTGNGGKTTPKPKPTKPPGHPPPYGFACFPPEYGGTQAYDTAHWDAGGREVARQRIFTAFEDLGYTTPAGRDTMNDPGKDEKLGGGDDIENEEVRRFQKDYNAVSRAKNFKSDMGGLDEDGYVGPCTLNGIKYVQDNLGDKNWRDLVAQARANA